jgi:hypothetical protein
MRKASKSAPRDSDFLVAVPGVNQDSTLFADGLSDGPWRIKVELLAKQRQLIVRLTLVLPILFAQRTGGFRPSMMNTDGTEYCMFKG